MEFFTHVRFWEEMKYLTRPNSGIVGKQGTKVLPLGCIAIDGPSLAKLRHGEAVEQSLSAVVDVRIALGVRVER
jgi:hypothetical protein